MSSCFCSGKREEVERKYTKAVIAEWRACKQQEAEEVRKAREAEKRAKAAREAARRSARQQEIAAQREARRVAEAAEAERAAQQAQHTATGCNGSAWPWTADAVRAGCGGSSNGQAATARKRPLTAAKKRVLQERTRQLLQRRAAVVQAKKEQQSLREMRQAQMAAKVCYYPCCNWMYGTLGLRFEPVPYEGLWPLYMLSPHKEPSWLRVGQ